MEFQTYSVLEQVTLSNVTAQVEGQKWGRSCEQQQANRENRESLIFSILSTIIEFSDLESWANPNNFEFLIHGW